MQCTLIPRKQQSITATLTQTIPSKIDAFSFRTCHERHNRNAVEAARRILAQIDEVSQSHDKLMEATRHYCTDAVLIEQRSPIIPVVAAFSSYCQRSAACYKQFGDCISVNTVDQLRATRKNTKMVQLCHIPNPSALNDL
jgi:hypothetical protein